MKKRTKKILIILVIILIVAVKFIICLHFLLKEPYVDINLGHLVNTRIVFRPYNVTFGDEIVQFPLKLPPCSEGEVCLC